MYYHLPESIRYILWFCVIYLMKINSDINERKHYITRRIPYMILIWPKNILESDRNLSLTWLDTIYFLVMCDLSDEK